MCNNISLFNPECLLIYSTLSLIILAHVFALNVIEKYISIKLTYFKVLIKETLLKIIFNTDMKFRNRETYVNKISLNICFW